MGQHFSVTSTNTINNKNEWKQRSGSPKFVSCIGPHTQERNLRIIAISDVHNFHATLSVPKGDVLVVAGDFTDGGTHSEVQQFNTWLGVQPHKYKIVICGNHEYALAGLQPDAIKSQLSNATHYLQNTGTTIHGVNFWGSPFVPNSNSDLQGFNKIIGSHWYKSPRDMHQLWQTQVPTNTHYLITHTPPFGILDKNIGCVGLTQCLLSERLVNSCSCSGSKSGVRDVLLGESLRVHHFGHVHAARGVVKGNLKTMQGLYAQQQQQQHIQQQQRQEVAHDTEQKPHQDIDIANDDDDDDTGGDEMTNQIPIIQQQQQQQSQARVQIAEISPHTAQASTIVPQPNQSQSRQQQQQQQLNSVVAVKGCEMERVCGCCVLFVNSSVADFAQAVVIDMLCPRQ